MSSPCLHTESAQKKINEGPGQQDIQQQKVHAELAPASAISLLHDRNPTQLWLYKEEGMLMLLQPQVMHNHARPAHPGQQAHG